MKNTTANYQRIIESFKWEWKPFKETLQTKYQKAFDELMNHAQKHAPASYKMINPSLFAPIIMSILVEQEKEIQKLLKSMVSENEQKKGLKKCPRCNCTDKIEAFYKGDKREDGLHILCLDCRMSLFNNSIND